MNVKRSFLISSFAGVALLAVGCSTGSLTTPPAPEGPQSFVSGETLKLTGTLLYWPGGQTGMVYSLKPMRASGPLFSAPIDASGRFSLTIPTPPSDAIGDFGQCQKQLNFSPGIPQVFTPNLAASKNGGFAGYVDETYGGKKDEYVGYERITYVYNFGQGIWVKGTCKLVYQAGAFTQTYQATYDNVYLHHGWNALLFHLDAYEDVPGSSLTEKFTVYIAFDESGFHWVFKDFYNN